MNPNKGQKWFEQQLEQEFVDANINSNGDLYLQAKDDDEDDARERLISIVRKLLSTIEAEIDNKRVSYGTLAGKQHDSGIDTALQVIRSYRV